MKGVLPNLYLLVVFDREIWNFIIVNIGLCVIDIGSMKYEPGKITDLLHPPAKQQVLQRKEAMCLVQVSFNESCPASGQLPGD